MDTLLFSFSVLVNKLQSFLEYFFKAWVRFCLTLLLTHFYRNICNWVPKIVWPRMDSFWSPFVEMFLVLSSLNLHVLKSQICSNCSIMFLFWRYEVFSINILKGNQSVFHMCPYFLVIGFSNIIRWALSMQCICSSYICSFLTLVFLQVVMKFFFDYLWNQFCFFMVFFQC